MDEEEIRKKLDELERFKNDNLATLQAWQEKVDEARKVLFKACCLKPYLEDCEPFYCGFRITGVCKYPEKFSELEDKLKIK